MPVVTLGERVLHHDSESYHPVKFHLLSEIWQDNIICGYGLPPRAEVKLSLPSTCPNETKLDDPSVTFCIQAQFQSNLNFNLSLEEVIRDADVYERDTILFKTT